MKTLQASFYFPASLCYDTVCRSVEIPWIPDFDTIRTGEDICVLAVPLGSYCAGLYVRYDKIWRLVLTFTDMCDCLATAASLQVKVKVVTPSAPPTGTILFKNGAKQSVLSIYAGDDVWASVLPASASGGGGGGGGEEVGVPDKNFIQAFVNQNSVTVAHNLAKFPAVTIVDIAGNEVEAEVLNNSPNSLTANFNVPFSGVIYVN